MPSGAGRDQTRTPIEILPPDVVALIAAGEVIERPASVVKELIENALDARAESIRIDVRGGGLTLIRVSDDGIGIPGPEIRLACERHATSKLRPSDLYRIGSLGFRGEALPSIATVADLTIVSAADDEGIGRRLSLQDGRIVVDEPAPRPMGSTVSVQHLFHNVPARLAAAKSARAENANIAQLVRQLAIAAPEVRMSLATEDRTVVQTLGTGDLEHTLIDVYGQALAGHLLVLGPVEAGGATIRVVISSPEITRSSRGQVTVVVNRRWARPRALLSAIEAAYRPLLPRGRHPVLALSIEADPADVDVNIHPAKLEIRLRQQRAIGEAVAALIREALGRTPISLSWQQDPELEPVSIPAGIEESVRPYDDDQPIITPNLPPLRLIGQVRDRLLLLEADTGLYLVDQHRAHERIIYRQLVAGYGPEGPERALLPEPLLIELSSAELRRFQRRRAELEELGFEYEEFGGRMFLLRSAPVLPGVIAGSGLDQLGAIGEVDVLNDPLVDLAGDDGGEGWRERLLIQLACRTAVRRGRSLSRSAMRTLVERLGETETPAVCPHGSPLLMHVSSDSLERQFGWR